MLELCCIKLQNNLSNAIVVCWLALLPLGVRVLYGFEYRPLIAVKAVHRTTCPLIVLRGQTAGSRAPMVLKYSRFVVLGF